MISVYCKPTFSGIFSHFDGFIPSGYKFNLASILILRGYSICCIMELSRKGIFLKNNFLKKVLQPIVPKKDINIFLPCLGKLSLSARSTLEKTIRDTIPCDNLKVVFRVKNRLSSKFSFKDKIEEMCSLLCYKFQCSSCNATYYGRTQHHFKVRDSENTGISALTDKNIKSTKNFAVRDLILVCGNIVSFEGFSVLANRMNDLRIKLQENPLKHLSRPLWCYSLKKYHICSFTLLCCSSERLDK